MSAYDYYDLPRTRHDHRRDRYGDPRDVRDPYVSSRELVPRHRDETELTVDRAYPAGYSSRDIRRARSADPGYYDDYYDREPHHSSRSRGGRKGYADSYYDAEEKRRRRVLSSQEKIIAAVAGAALAVGGKEVYDRRTAHVADDDDEIQRNYLHSAALGAAGAFAGYQGAGFYNKRTSKSDHKKLVVHRGRDGRVREEYEYSDDEDDQPAKKGHKNFLESALGVTSLGAAMKALTGGGKDSERDGGSHRGRSMSRDSGGSTKSRGHSMSKVQKAAMAGLLAGAGEAFRIAKEPGSFRGEKAKRVVTAAVGAGALGGAHGDDDHSKRDIASSVIGGLLGNRVVHGSRRNIEEDSATGRSRSRSRFRTRSESAGPKGSGQGGGLAALASAGLAAFGAKKAVDSRDDSRGRSISPDRHHRSRSRSVVDTARKSLAKLGIGGEPDDASSHGGSRSSRRHRRYSDNDDDYYRRPSRRDVADRDDRHYRYHDDDDGDDQSYRPRRRGRDRSENGSETDLGDSSDDERRARKMRGKQIITTGLATVASIHAAHGVYQSMGKRKTRQKAVKAGTMSSQEAKALKSKAILEDAASVGLAALGVKGAISELKEAREQSHECKLFKTEKQRRHDRRVERQRGLNNGYRRRRVENWSSPSGPEPIRTRGFRPEDESYAETLPPSPR